MVPNRGASNGETDQKKQNLTYIHEMLRELLMVAQRERADMLCYFIEMAYAEATDIREGRRPLSSV